MTVLKCDVVVGPGKAGKRWFDGEKLVLVELEDGTIVDRRHTLGYSPVFAQILPCPFCGTETDSNHDKMKHVDTHLRVRFSP